VVTGPLLRRNSRRDAAAPGNFPVRRDGKPLHLYFLVDVGAAFVLRTFRGLLLLRP